VLLASAMGVRNAVVRRIGVPDLTTTVLTMTLTGLASEATQPGGRGSLRRSSAVVAMLAGALAGALLLRIGSFAPLGLAAVIALATWLAYAPVAPRRLA
jgi:uncharacterized membrane protein YoaK (UPF0700 family)